jgi:hypothetical protein
MGWLRHRITYANVVSTLALVIALGGGADTCFLHGFLLPADSPIGAG